VRKRLRVVRDGDFATTNAARFNSSRFRRTRKARVSAYGRLLSVHLFPQMRNAAKIKTTISPTIDAVKSQLHTTEVFRFITQPDYAYQRRIRTLRTAPTPPSTRLSIMAAIGRKERIMESQPASKPSLGRKPNAIYGVHCCKQAIALKTPATGSMSVIAIFQQLRRKSRFSED
jgi:hypothetical protein